MIWILKVKNNKRASHGPVVEQEHAVCLEQHPSVIFDLQVLTRFPVEWHFAT